MFTTVVLMLHMLDTAQVAVGREHISVMQVAPHGKGARRPGRRHPGKI
jgi:hypothetical protein